MSQKGQQRVWDEFAWIIFAAVAFVLILTIIFTATTSKPLIEPKSVSLTLDRGDSHTLNIIVRSEDGGGMSNVSLSSFGEVRDWISFERSRFDVENSTAIKVRIDVPKAAILKTYTGGIKAGTSGGSFSVPVTITVANVSLIPLQARTIPLGDFAIMYAKGSETIYSQENVDISKGVFSGSKDAFSVTIPAEKQSIMTGARLEISIVDTNKKGNLIVEFNSIELYNRKTDVGKVVIPLDKSIINSTNIVNIRATGPSFIQFWAKSSYDVESVNFVINFEDTSERDAFFDLSRKEIDNFRHFQLQARVREYSSPVGELIVKINDQIVYAAKPPLALMNQTISKDILGNSLSLDTLNRISFSFEKEAFISLSDVLLVAYSS